MKVMIVAAAAHEESVRDYYRAGFQLWGINSILRPFALVGGPATAAKWFQIHPPWSCSEPEREWAARCPVTLEAIRHYPEWPASVPYPLDEILTHFPTARIAGFASSFAYAMALALHEGATDIALAGVCLSLGSIRERCVERGNLAYWIGVADGCRVRMHLNIDHHPAQSPGGNRLYGFEYQAERDAVAAWCRETRDLTMIDGP